MSNINGRKIAQAAAFWMGPEVGYVLYKTECKESMRFPSLVVKKDFLHTNGVKMRDLVDCIDQIEAYGSVEVVKENLGVEVYGGNAHPGLVVTSSLNERVQCVVTVNGGKGESAHDLFLEWYYDTDGAYRNEAPEHGFLESFQRLVGRRNWLNEGVEGKPFKSKKKLSEAKVSSVKDIANAFVLQLHGKFKAEEIESDYYSVELVDGVGGFSINIEDDNGKIVVTGMLRRNDANTVKNLARTYDLDISDLEFTQAENISISKKNMNEGASEDAAAEERAIDLVSKALKKYPAAEWNIESLGRSLKVSTSDGLIFTLDFSVEANGNPAAKTTRPVKKTRVTTNDFDPRSEMVLYNTGRPFGSITYILKDTLDNYSRLYVRLFYDLKTHSITGQWSLIGGKSGSGTPFAMSNMQNKRDLPGINWKVSPSQLIAIVESSKMAMNVHNMFGKDLDREVKAVIKTGVDDFFSGPDHKDYF
jgi:hypothetical protein